MKNTTTIRLPSSKVLLVRRTGIGSYQHLSRRAQYGSWVSRPPSGNVLMNRGSDFSFRPEIYVPGDGVLAQGPVAKRLSTHHCWRPLGWCFGRLGGPRHSPGRSRVLYCGNFLFLEQLGIAYRRTLLGSSEILASCCSSIRSGLHVGLVLFLCRENKEACSLIARRALSYWAD